jgi:hypothetical protein
MQWHWGNIGSFLAGLSTVAIAFAALKQGPAAVRAWIDAKRAQAEQAREDAETIRLERRRGLEGWSASGVNTYPVALVTEPQEIDIARDQLTGGGPTAYVVLRVTGTSDGGSANLADNLRQRIKVDGYIARAPTAGEAEAIRTGLDKMGIARSNY